MDFDNDGNLYVLTGDTNSSERHRRLLRQQSRRAARPRAACSFNDARRTAGNTNDLNGKILRIKPMADPGDTPGIGTTYTIPDGQPVHRQRDGGRQDRPLTRRRST